MQNINKELSDKYYITTSGRTEIAGNHTDHNHGKVIAASVNMKMHAVAEKNGSDIVRVKSDSYPEIIIHLKDTYEPNNNLFSTSDALIAGMINAYRNKGYYIGGFDACITSDILRGSGLSSSAAFEVTIGRILNDLFNNGSVNDIDIGKMAQYSENVFFGKPCGLMDQLACSIGGVIYIDFLKPNDPIIKKIPFNPENYGYKLCISNTGESHGDLTSEYAEIINDMYAVSSFFGKKYLREVNEYDFYKEIDILMKKVGERPVLRATHFFTENARVDLLYEAMISGDIKTFIDNIILSGASSRDNLKNIYVKGQEKNSGALKALELSESFLRNRRGAWRIHGGGFGGTIQAFVPDEYVAEYKNLIELEFGIGSCLVCSGND